MRAVVQRVRGASVTVNNDLAGCINKGLLVYLGVAADDTEKDAEWMAEKVVNLRIFVDSQDRMNLSLFDIIEHGGSEADSTGVLTVSQFTLLGDAQKGRRPYFGAAAEPNKAKHLYEFFVDIVKSKGILSEAGIFQAHMDVTYTNDGPVTIILDSANS